MKWIAPHGAATSTERYVNAQPTIAGSNPDAAFFNTVLDELLAVIVAADMTPTDENLHQIADAIEYLTERAATSGVTKGSYWFGKTSANFTVPNPTLPEQNYIDFTTLNTYSAKSDLSGWTQTGTFVPPVGIDFTILITSKFWDIPEQDGQQGGWAQYNHTDDEWSWWPKIISFKDAALTGTPTAPTVQSVNDNSTKIATTAFVTNVLGAVYPVGSLYFGTQSTCPMAILIPNSTWELVAQDRSIQGSSANHAAGTTIEAGLPDHNHTVSSYNTSFSYAGGSYGGLTGSTNRTTSNASASNPIYGRSDTVQPPAYVVNVWRRTA